MRKWSTERDDLISVTHHEHVAKSHVHLVPHQLAHHARPRVIDKVTPRVSWEQQEVTVLYVINAGSNQSLVNVFL